VADALRHHAVLGDIQTAASVLLVLGEHRRSLKLDEATQEHWLLGYIDWLARHQLWNISSQVNNSEKHLPNIKHILKRFFSLRMYLEPMFL